MNTGDFVMSLAEEFDLDRASSKQLVTMVFEHLRSCILEHGKVTITDFGSFVTRFKNKRTVANNLNIPGQQDDVQVPARLTLKFRPGKQLRLLLVEEGQTLYGDADEEEDDNDEA
ncbi:unnamed protein product [marine sediment metagenome]|uniref:HU domain-containing protein n=1 Tax=marine sediment metagenome TaxID=412755 RepID=X0SDX3_9ZZZZ